MIILKELLEVLDKTKLKYVFNQWKKSEDTPPKLPYIVYTIGQSFDFIADNENYLHQQEIHVDLYQDDSEYDFNLERTIRRHFIDAKIPFDMSEIIHVDDEQMYLTTLTFRVIEKDDLSNDKEE